MTEDIRQARKNIASEVGADISYFTPAEERRFEPVTIALTLGGIMLYEFCKAMVKKVGEKLGEAAGDSLGDAIVAAVKKTTAEPAEQGKPVEIEGAVRDWAKAVEAHRLTAEQIAEAADYVEAAIEKALVRQQKMPREKAHRIASRVRKEVLSLDVP